VSAIQTETATLIPSGTWTVDPVHSSIRFDVVDTESMMKSISGPPVDHDEAVAAEPGHLRLDDAERGGGRDGRIDRVAALLQDGDPRARRECLSRDHHPARAHHNRAMRRVCQTVWPCHPFLL
jgi:hypothetical protein